MKPDIFSLRETYRAGDRRNMAVPAVYGDLPAPSKSIESLAWIIAMESPMRMDTRVTLAAYIFALESGLGAGEGGVL